MLQVNEAVAAALRAGRPVVALESTIIAHGFAYPDNLELAHELEAAVTEHGATPATIAVMRGKMRVGLGADELAEIAAPGAEVGKAAAFDLGVCLASGKSFATTVSATMFAAARAGIAVFATGGIGGVHRGDSGDVSSDIDALARFPVAVVSAGAKAILDLPRTLEALETRAVPVIGYQTSEFPAFYQRTSGLALHHRIDEVAAAARVVASHLALDLGGLVIANPIAAAHETDFDYAAAIDAALELARSTSISGKALTPFLLAELHRSTEGTSSRANRALALGNAVLAAKIAVALSEVQAAG